MPRQNTRDNTFRIPGRRAFNQSSPLPMIFEFDATSGLRIDIPYNTKAD
jgi:hypothetical protein